MIQKCQRCKVKFEESTCSFYNRTHLKKGFPHPLCRCCKRIKLIFDNPNILAQQEEKKIKKNEKKEELKRFISATHEGCAEFLEYNRKKRLSKQREYLATDKGKEIHRDSMATRRAKVLGALLELSEEERKGIRRFYKECPKDFHVDHIIPISKGGKHCLENLQYLTSFANLSKSNKIDRESILGKLGHDENFSIGWLMRKFKVTRENAENIIAHLGIYEVEAVT